MSASDITKRAIQEAFIELLNEKPINKISVKDISERCGINRNTFYYHYQDMQSLFVEMCENDADSIIQQYPELNSIDECFEALMMFVRKNKKAAYHIYYSNSDSNHTYWESIARIARHVVRQYSNTVYPDSPISDYDRSLLIRYFSSSLFGVIIDWISSGMTDDYIEASKRMIANSRGAAELFINNCLKNELEENKDQQ